MLVFALDGMKGLVIFVQDIWCDMQWQSSLKKLIDSGTTVLKVDKSQRAVLIGLVHGSIADIPGKLLIKQIFYGQMKSALPNRTHQAIQPRRFKGVLWTGSHPESTVDLTVIFASAQWSDIKRLET
jgi:hypothetical protein